MADKRKNPLKDVSTYALFQELRKRQNISAYVIDDKYILEVNKKDVEV